MQENQDDLNKCFDDSMNIFGRVLSVCWNILMKALIAVNVMSFFKKQPKLLAVLIICLCILLSPIAILFAGMGIMALISDVSAEEDFLINTGPALTYEEMYVADPNDVTESVLNDDVSVEETMRMADEFRKEDKDRNK